MSKSKKYKAKVNFSATYKNQTNIGKQYGISAIKLGQILIENGLKDPITKQASKKALDEGFAVATPLKDGTLFYMWNVFKLQPLISVKYEKLPKEQYHIEQVKSIIRQASDLYNEGQDKLADLLYDDRYAEVPTNLHDKIYGRPEFEIELELCDGDFASWCKTLRDTKNKDYVAKVIGVINTHYPQYSNKLEKLLPLL
jgi:hypothetical protein